MQISLVRRPCCFRVITRMSSNSPQKSPIHPALAPISWLVGKWKGKGCGIYPTIKPFEYHEEITFDHFGKPILTYNTKSWSVDPSQAPMHYESGFLRVNPNTSVLAFMISHNAGFTEIDEGTIDQSNPKEIKLISHSIGRMSFSAEPSVTKIERIYKLTDPDTMEYIMSMETKASPQQNHLHITYKRENDK